LEVDFRILEDVVVIYFAGHGSPESPDSAQNLYLLPYLTEIGEGVCVISASRDKEFLQEGKEWGGGHGVFSYYLLEGLKGAADFDKSGSVRVGEITVYVSQQVRRATRNAQNPIVAGRFDPSLVIGK
jgi:uncharacterized caspase-like protein